MQSEHSKRVFRNELNGLDAYARHKRFVRDYIQFYGKSKSTAARTGKTEIEILEENHRFVRDVDETDSDISWEQRIAKRYYDKLFKEYAICELKRYKEGRIAMRWRTEDEVIVGKGQFECGSTRCNKTERLKSWEVNFGYMEDGEKKNELVKLRLCPSCSDKLNYKTQKRAAKEYKSNRHEKRRRSHHENHEDADEKVESKKPRHTNSDHEQDIKDEPVQSNQKDDAADIWKQPVKIDQDKTNDEQLDSYFADLLQ
ncbi:FRA10AC1-like protein [Umbelopsis sp. PMI_123]|nr:FRA10AC1-like protein [Umbelopsis sp. PMI_123]